MMTLEKKLERVQKFNFDGSPIRTVMIKGEPWFVAADVCEILGIENVGNALSRIKKDDIRSADVTDSIGRQQKTKIVSESGLYRIIFQSRQKSESSIRRLPSNDDNSKDRSHFGAFHLTVAPPPRD
jgi:anti-repressor protein